MKGWLIALLIIAAVVSLLAWLLSRKVHFNLSFDGSLKLFFRVLFVKLPIFPREEKRVKISDYSLRAIRRREKKAQRLKKRRKAKPTAEKPHENKPHAEKSILDNLSDITKLAVDTAKRVRRHGRVDVRTLDITVGTDDAAKTGILYGAVAQSVAYLLNMLGTALEMHADNVHVNADFTALTSTMLVEIDFSMRIWHFLGLLFKTMFSYFTMNEPDSSETNDNKINKEQNNG